MCIGAVVSMNGGGGGILLFPVFICMLLCSLASCCVIMRLALPSQHYCPCHFGQFKIAKNSLTVDQRSVMPFSFLFCAPFYSLQLLSDSFCLQAEKDSAHTECLPVKILSRILYFLIGILMLISCTIFHLGPSQKIFRIMMW